ncbi:MAG: DUF4982 domain-containing protein [Lachnospiraceae bacterium]|nr:DUF4982 domain-containing protein [Lachnospiraceae bacterium]
MKKICIDEGWTFRRGLLDSLGAMEKDPGVLVNLPHDGLISTAVSAKADARSDSGYFLGDVCNYTKYVLISDEWKDKSIGLKFDGAMMHASVEINGCKVAEHHYGYSPFYVDITDFVTFGEENRITVNLNTGVQPSSRWYTGSGLFRELNLMVGPKVHVADDGIYLYTKEVSDNLAICEALIDVCNDSAENRLASVTVSLYKDKSDTCVTTTNKVIYVNKGKSETARLAFTVENPVLWDCDNPNLYNVKVEVTDVGVYRTHLTENETETTDVANALFGIRTISVDAVRGLRINGKSTKLKGGCLHHDNGLLGAVSLYESEARKVRKLKETGFNAIRTTHNPPSAALVEACDREGMYIFDEAFDAWGIAKRTGDYSQYFSSWWEKDLTAFVRRDRVHPSVIMWSIGNEIPERGGLNNGYTLATKLAETIKKLDATRPVSNGVCSLWAGLDDYLAKTQDQSQNANIGTVENLWEKVTDPFTNGLDVVGYNYMEDQYEKDHEMFPDRVIVGSENFPQQIGFRWPLVESLPYVIGDFTWTAWDYLGEAGIGKAVYVTEDDELIEKGSWSLMPPEGSPFPWRTSNDADYDITGRRLAQGAYRSVVWGSEKTHLYSFHPDCYGKVEMMTMWGFPAAVKTWDYRGYEGSPVELIVFSNGDEVALLIDGVEVDRRPVSKERPLPNSVKFETKYKPAKVEAVTYKNGVEISRDSLVSTGTPCRIEVTTEKDALKADGHDVMYVNIDVKDEKGLTVTDASINLEISVEGAGFLAGFGTGNPITEEKYTDNTTTTFRGQATAIIRSGYTAGEIRIKVKAKDTININDVEVCFNCM